MTPFGPDPFWTGSAVDDINTAFLTSDSAAAAFINSGTPIPDQDANTGFAASVELSAAF